MDRKTTLMIAVGVLVISLVLLGCLVGSFRRTRVPQALGQVASSTPLPSILDSEFDSPIPTSTPTPTPTTPFCITATPEPLWVDPVTSPTGELSQMIVVYIGNGEAVTVTCESGTFAERGNFASHGRPAQVPVDLLRDTIHHLTVYGKVQQFEYNGCVYGGYTLSTGWDRFGDPLTIVQYSGPWTSWLPIIRDQP